MKKGGQIDQKPNYHLSLPSCFIYDVKQLLFDRSKKSTNCTVGVIPTSLKKYIYTEVYKKSTKLT